MSYFASVEMAPGDPILGLTETYLADPRPGKINLGVGIYVDEQGRIPLLPSVHDVENALAAAAKPRGYLPIDGLAAYNRLTQQLVGTSARPTFMPMDAGGMQMHFFNAPGGMMGEFSTMTKPAAPNGADNPDSPSTPA